MNTIQHLTHRIRTYRPPQYILVPIRLCLGVWRIFIVFVLFLAQFTPDPVAMAHATNILNETPIGWRVVLFVWAIQPVLVSAFDWGGDEFEEEETEQK